jgi:serine/threonine protein phosphatase 1
MRTFAIGDIHGCATGLSSLLDAVNPAKDDQIVFLGDYIDRGPSSKEVIQTLIDIHSRCRSVFLRGNHEVMLLDGRDDSVKAHMWQSAGGLETLLSYGAHLSENWPQAIPASHWSFFERTIPYFETETHIFVHACLDPTLALAEQPDFLLYWEYLERMKPHQSGKRVICGHTPQLSTKPKDIGYAVCIDTGAVFGGWLTCLDTGSGKYWQANQTGSVRTSSI